MLRGLERTTTRPRGGVNRVMLIAAGSFAGDGFVESSPAAGSFAAGSFTGAEDDRAAGRMVSFAATEPPVEYVFREDGARWSESVVTGGFSVSGASGASSSGSGGGSSGVALGGLSVRVKHTLSMEFPLGEASRMAVSEIVALSGSGSGVGSGSYGGSGSGLGSGSGSRLGFGSGWGGGFVAIVTLASGERIIGGYSSRFGVGYPLRVVKVTAASGSVPGDYAAISIVLESEDADFAKSLV